MDDPTQFLIRSKSDLDNANRLVEMGHPAVTPVLSHMVEWIQDMNWPVAHVVAPFLGSLGDAMVPEVRKVLDSDDLIWKYWMISEVVARLPTDIVAVFRSDLERLAYHSTSEERKEGLEEEALEQLQRIDSQQQSGA